MAEENADQLQLPAEPAAKSNPIIPIAIVTVLSVALSYALASFLIAPEFGSKVDEAIEGKTAAEKAMAITKLENTQTVEFNGIIANLRGTLQGRYIKVTFSVQGDDPKFSELMEMHAPRVKNAALSILQTLTMQELDQGGAMNIVRAALITEINRAFEPAPALVHKLYFSEFVVQ